MKRNWVMETFVLVLAMLGIIGGCSSYRASTELEQSKALNSVYRQEIEIRGTIIKNQAEEIDECSSTLEKAVDRLNLLTTFKDADFEVTPETVRDLLELADTLPYGSPFPAGHKITSKFGMRTIERYGWYDQKHLGIDLLPVDGNWTIYMPVDGYISDWGFSDLYGNFIEITTESGYRIFMGHLDYIYYPHEANGIWSIDSHKIVKKGVRIGIAGTTGQYCTGRHLHYEVWIFNDGNYVPLDPAEIIKYTGGESEE